MLDDHRVYLILMDKLRWAGGSTIKETLGNAFDLISYDRENDHKGEAEYAAAEHYLFARWLIAWTNGFGYPFLAVGAGGYTLIKRLLPQGVLDTLAFGDGPVTPYVPGDVQWCKRGGDDGLTDFRAVIWGELVPQDPPDP